MSLSDRITAEARAERTCTKCGTERDYRRVWRHHEGKFHVYRGTLELACPHCTPRLPGEVDRPPRPQLPL